MASRLTTGKRSRASRKRKQSQRKREALPSTGNRYTVPVPENAISQYRKPVAKTAGFQYRKPVHKAKIPSTENRYNYLDAIHIYSLNGAGLLRHSAVAVQPNRNRRNRTERDPSAAVPRVKKQRGRIMTTGTEAERREKNTPSRVVRHNLASYAPDHDIDVDSSHEIRSFLS
jgi:hypothetical protein